MVRNLLLTIFAAGVMFGQGFDVASIKPSDPLAPGTSVGIAPGGVFRASGVTLKVLIQQAYQMGDFQISGGPGWIDKDRYEILAKADDQKASEADLMKMTKAQQDEFQAQMQAKLRALLADRFQLKVRRETKELPVYALTVAKNGAKLEAKERGPQSGFSVRRGEAGKVDVTGKQADMATLMRHLSGVLGRPVVDKTGLEGTYDFKLSYTPDVAVAAGAGDGPSLFTALQEQLGLKLDSTKGPVEVLVIESAAKASEN